MAGIYLHIPFCKQACHYCNFHFSTSLKLKDALVDAMLLELENRRGELAGQTVETIYFGGGTPSMLTKNDLDRIFNTVYKHFSISDNPEITLEANPDDLTPTYLEGLRQTPMNRLSVGIQSFRDEDLRYMNRAHNAHEANHCVQLAQDKGFEAISIDLIYAMPTATDADWEHNLQTALQLRPQHLSAYCLTVETGTALNHMVKKGTAPAVDEEAASRQFMMLTEMTRAAGYEHYEVSNLARDGHYARHNSSYWKGKPYLGVGPAAHSYNGLNRRWNVSNNNKYIKAINAGEPFYETETLTTADQYNEFLMTRLRTMWGVPLQEIVLQFGEPARQQLLAEASSKIINGQMVLLNDHLILTTPGRLIADGLISDLFWV
ncbi:radical SAM family heme chaperone HemW [soil metagenome]